MGYDLARFVTPDIDKDLICPICMNVLENPAETPCEHAFCRNCLLKWLERRRRCPLDQTVLSASQLWRPSRLLTNQLARLQIRCPFSEQGCTETMPLELEASHRLKCRYSSGAGHRAPPPAGDQLPPRHGRPAEFSGGAADEDMSWSGAAVGLVGLAGVLGAVVAGVMGYQRGVANRRD